MSDLVALAGRVEAATGADRAIDADIWRALGNCVHAMELARVEVEVGEYDVISRCKHCHAAKCAAPPRYTASIDAAKSLAPEGYWTAFDPHFMDDEGVVRFKGYAMRPDWTRWTPHADWIGRITSELCATPALALLAAALLARYPNPLPKDQ